MFWRRRKTKPEETVEETVELIMPNEQENTFVSNALETEQLDTEVVETENPISAPIVRQPLVSPEKATVNSDLPKNIEIAQLEGDVIEAISTIYDPEIPVNIYELGLIYDLQITADNRVQVEMTLTSPACPVAGTLPGEVEQKVREVEGVEDVALELVWEPAWTPERMTEAARLELGFM